MMYKIPVMTKFNSELFSKKLREHRTTMNYSLRYAAGDIGISQTQVMRLEKQECIPDIETFFKCCEWMKENPLIFKRSSMLFIHSDNSTKIAADCEEKYNR